MYALTQVTVTAPHPPEPGHPNLGPLFIVPGVIAVLTTVALVALLIQTKGRL